MPVRVSAALSAAVSLLVLAGCGSAPSPAPGGAAPKAGFPYTVRNCGTTTTYRRPPQHAVTMNQHATEIMLALGLQTSMAGTAYKDDAILPAYRRAYDSVKVLAKQYPSQEALLSAEPDFVYGGFSSAFDEKQGRGRSTLAKDGVHTYLNIENCTSGKVTLDTGKREITTVGRIFGVPDRARKLTAKMDADVAKTAAALPAAAKRHPTKVFVYDSGTQTAFTAGGAGIGNDIIARAGGRNVFADLPKRFGNVSFEQVAQRAPDVIVIYDYGGQSVAAKKAELLGNPALKNVPAITHRRFAVLPLSSTVLGVRVPDAIASLAAQLYPGAGR